MAETMFTHLAARKAEPDRVFIEAADGRTLSYARAYERTGRIANTLARRGVKPGDRVAVQVEKSAEAILLYLACLRSGAVYLPLNMGYTLAELDYFIGDATPSLLVCAPDRAEALRPIAQAHKVGSVLTLGAKSDGTLAELAENLDVKFRDFASKSGDLAAILYTSGTTGRSKGAMITQRNLASNAKTLAAFWRFTDDDVLLHALPIFHTHGLFVETNTILVAGARMIFLPKFDPDAVFSALPRATAMMGVPTFYTRLLADKRLTKAATKHMRLFVSGSAPLLAETHREWSARTGHAILERYGMTETNMITSNPYDGQRVPGSVGPALPGITTRVVDPETGKRLPAGEVGMIEVKGPNVFKGYWQMPEKTKAEFRDDGFFVTGDLGKMDRDGVVTIVGRGKDLVISGGYNVYPKEIECEIDALEGVTESAVVGVAHPDFGEAVTAVVVRGKGCKLDERAVMAALEPRLAKYKQPKRVIFVDDLPRNTMGKVLKNALRDTYKDLYAKAPAAKSKPKA